MAFCRTFTWFGNEVIIEKQEGDAAVVDSKSQSHVIFARRVRVYLGRYVLPTLRIVLKGAQFFELRRSVSNDSQLKRVVSHL